MNLIKTDKTRNESLIVNLDLIISLKVYNNTILSGDYDDNPNYVICFMFGDNSSILWEFNHEEVRDSLFSILNKDTKSI